MQTNDTIFDRYHPAVALIYCGVLLAFSIAAMHPVYLLAMFAGLVAYNAVLRGAKAALSGMLWQAPLVLILAIANPLFVSAGSTELFRLGTKRHAPPRRLAAARASVPTQTTSPDPRSRAARLSPNSLRLSTVLMSWGMEDSLETADAMRARGWGAATKRTTYQRYRFRKTDAFACAFIAVLTVAAAASAAAACGEFKFYPRIAGFDSWFSYIPYVLLVALPTILEAKERRTWLR